MKRFITIIPAAAVVVLLAACGSSSSSSQPVSSPPATAAGQAAAAPTAPTSAAVMIQHVMRGCHAWVIGGTAPTSAASVTLGQGGTLTVTDNDVMPHQLQTRAAGVSIVNAKMSHIGAKAQVTFPHTGTYTFTTRAGEDYMKGVKTIGADNALKLTVTVA